ncbi:RND superfamily efflux pump MFP component [Oceaniferula spumae]|uniref:RND superfamily efflux pump MFP component n=1 Tax=Oceaniferula spumae TaxID=2979115 RepID=A0AAT9FI32_9BACT
MQFHQTDKLSLRKQWMCPGSARTITIIVISIGVLVAGVIGMSVLKKTGPKADKTAPPKVIPVVNTITAVVTDKQLEVTTQGEVEARMSTQLASEVMGRVTMVSPKLKAGGSFEKNELMLEIDNSDYVSAQARVQSALADAKLALQQEEARAEQSMRDWRKLGKGDAPDLVARKPQIASARARVKAAEADVGKATRDLERTKIRAPYLCKIDKSYIDFGAYISPGAPVADIYSIQVREVRVPVPLDDLAYLPEQGNGLIGSEVKVEADLAGKTHQWTGKIIRSEGKVDRSTMMIYLVVEIASGPNQSMEDLPPPGLFVNAAIKGRMMKNLVEMPRSALRDDNTVLTLDENSQLKIVSVDVARTMEDTVLITSGITPGVKIITSAMETPVPGMELTTEQPGKD